MLGTEETPELDHPSSILSFQVKDIKKTPPPAPQLLLERNVPIVAPPRLIDPIASLRSVDDGISDREGNIWS